MEYPRLIEPSVKNYLYNTLQKCHDTKELFYTWVFNISVLAVFVLVVGSLLYYCRKRKLTPYEESEKQRREQDYILAKIRQYQTVQKTAPVTNLPYT
jgi:heme exporter protein D